MRNNFIFAVLSVANKSFLTGVKIKPSLESRAVSGTHDLSVSPAHTDRETCQWHFQDQPNKSLSRNSHPMCFSRGLWLTARVGNASLKLLHRKSNIFPLLTTMWPQKWYQSMPLQMTYCLRSANIETGQFSSPKSWVCDLWMPWILWPHMTHPTLSHLESKGHATFPFKQLSLAVDHGEGSRATSVWLLCPFSSVQGDTHRPVFQPPLLFLSPPAGYCKQGKGKLGVIPLP